MLSSLYGLRWVRYRTRMSETRPSRPAPSDAIELRAQGVCKSFGERVVLEGIDLDVARGEFVAIVGGSGSGKTVLLHLLSGLMPVTEGHIFVSDHSREGAPLVDLGELEHDQIEAVRMHWGFVFQRNALFSGTVFDNVALLLREHTDLDETQIGARVRKSIEDVALDVDDVLTKDRDDLSGGMAKRVAIARAIAIDPALLFYDEPTTGLDPVIGAHIHDLLFTMHNQQTRGGRTRTSVVVTHDRDLLRRLRPRVLMLHEGRICFLGPYEEFEKQEAGPAAEYMRAMPVLQARR